MIATANGSSAPPKQSYVVLVRASGSLELLSAHWCSCQSPITAAEAILTITLSDEALHERAQQMVEAEANGGPFPILLELTHSGAPGGVAIFDDESAHQTYEVINVTTLVELASRVLTEELVG